MPDAPRSCDPHLDLVAFKYSLPHLTQSLKRQRKTKIVAIGSSSTAGEKSSTGEVKIVPFPHRLELALRNRSYGRMIDVLNRGFGGQEAPDQLSRFEPDVIGEAPALVIWQVGTNAVFHSEVYSPDEVIAAIVVGLDWLSGLAMDVVLMDLQYTTAVIEPDDRLKLSEKMVSRISAAAEKAHVNVFRRFDLMRQWCLKDNIPIADLIDPEDTFKLHMSDWATNGVTQALFGAIAGAPPATA
jgi:acyl-CoA thioesterase I